MCRAVAVSLGSVCLGPVCLSPCVCLSLCPLVYLLLYFSVCKPMLLCVYSSLSQCTSLCFSGCIPFLCRHVYSYVSVCLSLYLSLCVYSAPALPPRASLTGQATPTTAPTLPRAALARMAPRARAAMEAPQGRCRTPTPDQVRHTGTRTDTGATHTGAHGDTQRRARTETHKETRTRGHTERHTERCSTRLQEEEESLFARLLLFVFFTRRCLSTAPWERGVSPLPLLSFTLTLNLLRLLSPISSSLYPSCPLSSSLFPSPSGQPTLSAPTNTGPPAPAPPPVPASTLLVQGSWQQQACSTVQAGMIYQSTCKSVANDTLETIDITTLFKVSTCQV